MNMHYKAIIATLCLFFAVSPPDACAFDFSNPTGPDHRLTPGDLCSSGNVRRYPEGIRYCVRAVGKAHKEVIFRAYIGLGFQIDMTHRRDFKIDHLIPLCVGGSNEPENLWPQHFKIYRITDPLEPAVCERMAQGKMKQREAIELVLRGKLNLDEVPKILEYIKRM